MCRWCIVLSRCTKEEEKKENDRTECSALLSFHVSASHCIWTRVHQECTENAYIDWMKFTWKISNEQQKQRKMRMSTSKAKPKSKNDWVFSSSNDLYHVMDDRNATHNPFNTLLRLIYLFDSTEYLCCCCCCCSFRYLLRFLHIIFFVRVALFIWCVCLFIGHFAYHLRRLLFSRCLFYYVYLCSFACCSIEIRARHHHYYLPLLSSSLA